MGDPSTHVVLYNAYWHLVFEEDGEWVDTKEFSWLCKIGEEDAKIELRVNDAD